MNQKNTWLLQLAITQALLTAYNLRTRFYIHWLRICRKGFYPYEYMNSLTCSKDKLPDRCEFFSSLKDECINEKDQFHAINFWNTLKMNTAGDYHDLHLKTDVLLLADVFEKFINTCLEYYGSDPCHYFSNPGLSWDSMLEMTDD